MGGDCKMIKVGQIYKEKKLPYWRKHESTIFVICCIEMTHIYVIDTNGKTDFVGVDWLKADYELIAEYQTWNEAVNSKEFKGE